jgi:hypothetical protein
MAKQLANAGICTVCCTHSSQRSNFTHDASIGHRITLGPNELLVGVVRCRMGRFMDRVRVHHAAVQRTDNSRTR